MSNPATGVLIFERAHKVIVPIEWDNQRIHFFNFIKLLWALKSKKLHEENITNMFEENYSSLYERLPMCSLTPCKEKDRAGISTICVESEDENPPSQNIRLHFNNTNSGT
ncbi:168_t:CDS:2 [Entrophospora sp. SA101]|nr:2831_t:CDS:2 [Entrophospora sp. SA101]CAJ0639823.1 168_t:CDS:2 [Entrophospora sp. SA101]CAJ0842766.1 9929_t:CDS:2 [Entrophospora sp. SA101]CAJ0845350.1 11822_t:CDS:2 [Entrophospora sp. SA101]